MLEKSSEKEIQERVLEALLLEGLESGDVASFTRADFEEIKRRGLEKIENRQRAEKQAN